MNDNFNEVKEQESEEKSETTQISIDDYIEQMQLVQFGAICKSCCI
jgi:hypothetical protein